MVLISNNAITLSPMKRGVVGTQTVNTVLQAIINPHAAQTLMHHGFTYHIGDRVMQIKNNYDTFIFNGDTGIITAIESEEQTITVQFTDTTVTYTTQDLDELVPAYAISIHKSQGSEFDAVIICTFYAPFYVTQ